MNPLAFTGSTLLPDLDTKTATPVIREQTAAETPGAYQTFEAAKRGGFRGWFYFPNLDPTQQLNSWTRAQINRRANWLYNNVGVAKSIVNRSARYEAGTGLWPKPRTANKVWNKTAMNHFHDRVADAEVFDLAGDVNYYSGQIAILRHAKIFGDHFGQRVISDTAGTPQMRFVASYAVDNADIALDQSMWQDGVRTNGFGKPLQYRVLQNDRSQFTDVSASDMMRFRGHSWSGQRRCVSIFHHAVKHLFDIDDILFFEKAGVKLSSQIGYVLTVPGEGSSGPAFALPGATAVEQVQLPENESSQSGSSTKLTIQKIFGQGPVVPELPPGAKLDLVKSDRTSAAFTGFLDFLIRDVAWGCEYSPEFLWFLAGIGGAPMRFIIEDAATTIADVRQNLLIPQYCRPFYKFFMWNEMKAERLDYPGDDWFRADHLTPQDIRVDKGREGKLDDDRFATGKISGRMYYGPMGWDEEEVEDDIIEAYERKLKKCQERKLDFERVFRPPPNTAAAPEDPGAINTSSDNQPEDPNKGGNEDQ